jgi:uncharacterized protein YukE
MTRALQLAHLALLIAATALIGVVAWQGFVISRHVEATINSLNNTLTNINRPCKGKAGPDACGTLAQLNKTVIDIGNITVTAQTQVKQSATLIAQYGQMLNGIAQDIHGEMGEAQKATAALTGTAQAATKTLGTADSLISSEQPRVDAILAQTDTVLESGNEAVRRFDAMLADPNLALTMKNVEGITATTNHMLFTADAVETKATKSYLHPSTNPAARTWEAVKPFIYPAAQVGAAIALH